MHQYYQLDDEVRVAEDPSGHRQVGMRRSVRAPSEALQNHVKAVREFRDGMVALEEFSVNEIDRQEEEIAAQIEHGEFFLKDSRHFSLVL